MPSNELSLYGKFETNGKVDPNRYGFYDVKRGLRNNDGTGVVAGITTISNVHGYIMDDSDKRPTKGRLTLRGYDISELVEDADEEGRFGFEEVAYLLFAGDLPTCSELAQFNSLLDAQRDLPSGFVKGLILHAPSHDTMNMMARSILNLYAYDQNADDTRAKHEVDTAISLLARLPRIAPLSYHAKLAAITGKPMVWHPAVEGYSTAETILYMLRPDSQWTPAEARLLDIMLMLHAEHGGGNNSTFTCRVLSSSGTDAYSAYAGAIGSLKGPKHGGANNKVTGMHEDLARHVADCTDDGQVADYLRKILNKEAYDKSGLIYGMGHAVYTLSDPRCELCKAYAKKLAEGTEYQERFELLERIERLAPEILAEKKGSSKEICANIDMYSGLVYEMLGIPPELFTPLFSVARITGWAAHRFEELTTGKRIIRPAYKSVTLRRKYVPIAQRGA